MHLNILSPQQVDLLPLIRRFKWSFYLVGGTAIALHLGHRRSIDFDLFTPAKLPKSRVRKVLREVPHPGHLLHEDVDYTESVDYLVTPVPDERVREGLIDLSTRIL